MSNKQFTLTIDKFAEVTKSTLSESARAIKISLFSGLIPDTRVDTGRLKGNWQTSTGRPITVTIERFDKEGNTVLAEIRATVTEYGIDYITNNLPYAPVWNERDGIIDRNLARIDRNVREAVASSVR